MYYAPHILQLRAEDPHGKDEFGRPIPSVEESQWIDLCECRADKNPAQEFTDENGHTFRPDYHVVFGVRNLDIKGGDVIRVIWKSNGEVKCQGKVVRPKGLNYLDYGDFWVQV